VHPRSRFYRDSVLLERIRLAAGFLERALARPAATFGGEDLYPDIADKAAALMHSLALNHPFVDGNKRVAAFAAIVFAESNGHGFLATPDELVEATLAVAEGKMAVEAVAIFRQRLRSVE
jgi:death-on-curing protein